MGGMRGRHLGRFLPSSGFFEISGGVPSAHFYYMINFYPRPSLWSTTLIEGGCLDE